MEGSGSSSCVWCHVFVHQLAVWALPPGKRSDRIALGFRDTPENIQAFALLWKKAAEKNFLWQLCALADKKLNYYSQKTPTRRNQGGKDFTCERRRSLTVWVGMCWNPVLQTWELLKLREFIRYLGWGVGLEGCTLPGWGPRTTLSLLQVYILCLLKECRR